MGPPSDGGRQPAWEREERRDLVPLACRACGSRVQVQKFSWQHTSVQWTSEVRAGCPELHDEAEAVGVCAALRDTVEQAALDGVVPVFDPAADRTTREAR